MSGLALLMTVGRTAEPAFNFQADGDAILRALTRLSATAEEANFADACRLAAEIANSQESAEIILVTDSAIRPADFSSLAALKSPVKLVRVGGRSGNLAITNFRLRRNLDSPTDYEAVVSLMNTFDAPREVEVQLLLGGTAFDLAKIQVPAGGEAVQVFREKLRVGGVLEARIGVDDALAEDNVAWEILRPPPRLRVLLVSDDTSPSSFLVRAVGSDAGAVEGMVVTPEQYRRTLAANPAVLRGQCDAVIFDRWAPEKAEELPPAHLLAIDCVPPGQPVTAGEALDKPLIRKWEQGHPLMSYLNLRNVFISSARRLAVAGADDPVSPRAAKGGPPVERVAELVASPLVLAWERQMPGTNGRSRPQRFVVAGFNPRESDIVLRKELPLLLWNTLLWFQADGEAATQIAPGETIAIAAPDSGASQGLAVVTPDGRSAAAAVDAAGVAYFTDTRAPGIYRYRIGAKEDAFAVNGGRRSESDVRPVDLGFKAEELDAVKLAALWPAGRGLWPYLLLAAAALLAVEAVLYHRRVSF